MFWNINGKELGVISGKVEEKLELLVSIDNSNKRKIKILIKVKLNLYKIYWYKIYDKLWYLFWSFFWFRIDIVS